MSSDNVETNIGFYVSIVTGLLLTVSETLPYISSIRSNGIMQLITDTLLKKRGNLQVENDEQADEETNLIQHSNQPYTSHILSEASNVTITSQNVQFTFNSPNVKLDFNESV